MTMRADDAAAKGRGLEEGALDTAHTEFETLYEQYYSRIFGYVMRNVMDTNLAEDIVSQTFLKALAGFPRYRGGPDRFAGWLYRIATNTLLDHYRRRRKEKGDPLPESTAEMLLEHGVVALDNPREALERLERYQQLHNAIQQLKDIYRVSIVLHYFEGNSVKEISRILRCSQVTTRWRLFHARRQLAAVLRKGDLHDEV